ncbi:MAG: iron complex transport system substrate-binding protein [Candidatus Azotimanducaceae bacterium]
MLVLAGLLLSLVVQADITVEDDLGHVITLEKPALRIISLAPHLTELLYTLEVGDQLVGTARYSTYPAAALAVPRVGDAFSINIELIVSLRPDLILAWHTGGVNKGIARLRDLGLQVYVNESPSLESIGDTLLDVGQLAGSKLAASVSNQYREELAALRVSYEQPPSVFFQISDSDLYSVSDQHLIGQAIRHCGGRNIFPVLPSSVAQVSQEAVLANNPNVLLVTQVPGQAPGSWFDRWRSFDLLTGRLVAIDPNLISRPSFRMLAGIEQVCAAIKPS